MMFSEHLCGSFQHCMSNPHTIKYGLNFWSGFTDAAFEVEQAIYLPLCMKCCVFLSLCYFCALRNFALAIPPFPELHVAAFLLQPGVWDLVHHQPDV